jgi:hypothetical protein
MPLNVQKLRKALADLIGFLAEMKSAHWERSLKEIDERLSDPSTVERGRRELEDCFGGMGSLNDLYFCELNSNLPAGNSQKEVNAEFARLIDAVFRENRLASMGIFRRLLWRSYEGKHRSELPPRVKKSLRAR